MYFNLSGTFIIFARTRGSNLAADLLPASGNSRHSCPQERSHPAIRASHRSFNCCSALADLTDSSVRQSDPTSNHARTSFAESLCRCCRLDACERQWCIPIGVGTSAFRRPVFHISGITVIDHRPSTPRCFRNAGGVLISSSESNGNARTPAEGENGTSREKSGCAFISR